MANETPANQTYPTAIILATFSFITMLLIQPPLFWHFRNCNIAATVLISWLTILLLFNFVNAVLWPNDDFNAWYNGVGLCDVESKIQIASEVALPASLACILRALAAVLDTDRAIVNQTRAQKRRARIVDCVWCIGLPLVQMLFHYLVQAKRYYIFGISGCVPAIGWSWLSFTLIVIPPAFWVAVGVYFAFLIVIRLYRYRLSFGTILAHSNTTRSRFLRLYLLCVTWLLCAIPLEIYIVWYNIQHPWHPYSWSESHGPALRTEFVFVRSDGYALYTSWISFAFGILVFSFFGFGKEAVGMYRSCLLAMRLDKIFPKLNPENRSSISTSTSFSCKAKAFFKRTRLSSTSVAWMSGTPETLTSSKTDSLSTKGTLGLDSLPERFSTDGKVGSVSPMTANIEMLAGAPSRPSIGRRIVSLIHSKQSEKTKHQHKAFEGAELSGNTNTVRSEVSGGDISGHRSLEVIVRKEVRQGSEHH